MAIISITTLKTKFESGDRPTGQDFADLIDTTSYRAESLGGDGNNSLTVNGIETETVFDTIDISLNDGTPTLKFVPEDSADLAEASDDSDPSTKKASPSEISSALTSPLDRYNEDRELPLIILTSDGSKSFTSGELL